MASGTVQTGLIEQIKINNDTQRIASTAYGVCATDANNASKTVQIDGFELISGVTIHVKFTYDNTAASSPTLNVNGTGAINIVQYNNVAAGTASETSGWQAGAVLSLTYDGTYWVRDSGYNTNTTYATLTQTLVNTGTEETGKLVTAKIMKDTVTNAINALDVSNISGFGAGKTLATLTETDGKIAATFEDISIQVSQISDFPLTITPSSHTHGNITNIGALQTSDITIADGDKLIVTDHSDNDKIARTSIEFDGATTSQVLSQKGVWVSMYTHPTNDGNKHVPATGTTNNGKFLKAGNTAGAFAWADLTVSDITDFPSSLTPSSHTHGNIQNDGTLGDIASYGVATDENKKIVAVDLSATTPAASGNATAFITSITQDARGQITTINKSSIPTATDEVAGIMQLGVSGGAAAYSHTHGNINSDGTIGSANAIRAVVTNASNQIITDNFTQDSPNPDSSLTAISFIDYISQGASGKITATKKNITLVSSSSAGLVPQGAAVTTQSSSTKFLREDGNWAVPSYSIITSVWCDTAANTAAKVSSNASYYTLREGNIFEITFRYANSAQSSLTLNINGTGAQPLFINGNASNATNYTIPAGKYLVYYDGTNYQIRTDGKIPISISGDAATVNNLTVQTAVPQNAVFTDTWNALSTSQAGYVAQAPNDTTKFLRGDATWATLPTASTSNFGITKLSAAANDATVAATAKSVYDLSTTVSGLIASADALVFKGTISGSANTNYDGAGTLTPTANCGWTYKVDTVGYINGLPVEVGDIIICTTDDTPAATTSGTNKFDTENIRNKWVIIQNNVDGAVFKGTPDFTDTHVIIADGANGKVKDSGFTIGTSVPSNAVFTDHYDWIDITNKPTSITITGAVTASTTTLGSGAISIATTVNHGHGNLTSDGKLSNANKLAWTGSDNSLEASSHWASATKIAINNATEPSENFYVSGTSKFNIYTSNNDNDTANEQKVTITGNNRFLSFGSEGIMAYRISNNTTSAGTLSLQQYGGNLNIGSSDSNGTNEFYGTFNFKTTSGLNFSGITDASDNAALNIWFSSDGSAGVPTYDTDFNYNPSTNTLVIDELTIIGGPTDSSLSTTGDLYLNTLVNQSLIFTKSTANTTNEIGRFDTSGNFVPTANSSNTIGTNSLPWYAMYATTFHGALNGNAATATSWASAQTVYVTLGTASTITTLTGGSQTAETIGVDGILAISNGGTGTSSTPTQWGIIYASSTTAYASTGAGQNGDLLSSQGTDAPRWIPSDSTNSASSIVKRDANGGFSAGSVNLTGLTINLTNTGNYIAVQSNGVQCGAWALETLGQAESGGTAAVEGWSTLYLGNNSASSVDNNASGRIYLYNNYGVSVALSSMHGTLGSTARDYISTSYFSATQVFGAVWNDYAEFRSSVIDTPGACMIENDNGILSISNARLIPGACIISDTYGYSQGETDHAKTPIAVSGRVLAYTYLPREMYHAGMAVCSAPGGTVDIMTREEIRDYPDAIVGIVSEIPDYEYWGSGHAKVNGRIWIKIK